MNNISVIAQFRKKKTTDSAGVIIIRAFYNRKPVKARSTGFRILQDHWDHHNRRVYDHAPNASLLNASLNKLLVEIQAELLKKQMASIPIDAAMLSDIVAGGSSFDFIKYADRYIDDKRFADGHGYDGATKYRYRMELERLKKFQPAITFNQITDQFLQKYKEWMQQTYRKKNGTMLEPNSIWKALSFIRTVWNDAERNSLVSDFYSPFKNFKVGRYKQAIEKIRFLELHELEAVEKMLIERAGQLDIETLQVGWRFLFMCVSGLRISDAKSLTDASLKNSILSITPHKTKRHGNTATVHLVTERQHRYYQKTMELSIPEKSKDRLYKVFNDQLQLIARLSGINKHITSHTGRHTMGSFIVDGNVDDKAAKEILGIKNSEVIRTYMHIKEQKLLSETAKLGNVF